MRPTDQFVQAFRWNSTTTAQRRVLLAAGLGWMLDAFDVMLYSIVLATLMRAFGMSRTTAGLLNSRWRLQHWAGCSSAFSPTALAEGGCSV
jgi:hypothetical protein